MNYWIFIVTQRKVDGAIIEAEQILQQRLEDQFWGLGESTPNRRNLRTNDRVIFYVGSPKKVFAATAILATDSFAVDDTEKQTLSHGKKYFRADYGVRLKSIQLWEEPRAVKELIPMLTFIENAANWGAYFQGGVRQLSETDFNTILEARIEVADLQESNIEAIVSHSQFALEAHLEEFIDRNWHKIQFGADLERYTVDEQSGRQFPAGTWSIDFLCLDKATNDFVIIELKRGKSSDAVVGQVLRYMAWVAENIASPDQDVRGIIVCQYVDEALKYSVRLVPNLNVLTYQVDFKLLPFAS